MSTRTIRYSWNNTVTTVGMDEAGSGLSVVLLPALSSISTRVEMRPLFETLAPEFQVSTVDWPGFGDLVRLRTDWSPPILSSFLDWFLSEIVAPPHIVVAAGHAASYALYQAAHRHGMIERLVLIAPTWRGPLPTMMGGQRPWFARVRVIADHRGIGPLLYRLNMSRFIVTRMAREHVYEDPNWLSGDRLSAKLAVTRIPAPGMAPFASSAAHWTVLQAARPFLSWPGRQTCRCSLSTVIKRRQDREPKWRLWRRCREPNSNSFRMESYRSTRSFRYPLQAQSGRS